MDDVCKHLLSSLNLLSYLVLEGKYILQMWKLRQREVNELTSPHLAGSGVLGRIPGSPGQQGALVLRGGQLPGRRSLSGIERGLALQSQVLHRWSVPEHSDGPASRPEFRVEPSQVALINGKCDRRACSFRYAGWRKPGPRVCGCGTLAFWPWVC